MVRRYVDGITPSHRPLFDRLHVLTMEAYPQATVSLSYGMPTYRVGERKLHVGVWRHGLSLYGWAQGREAEFVARHPGSKTGKGTIRIRTDDSAIVTDDDLRVLIRAALDT